MQVLTIKQVTFVSGGMSEKMIDSVKEGGMMGGTEGAVIGGLLSVPLWSMAMGPGGNIFLASICVVAGIGAGSLLGGVLGVCAGYGLYWWSGSNIETLSDSSQ